ncbi:GGDEF domain-containing phosphodiesterase [Clostridium sp. D33t1_170424_F3]|uniref:EAL domain-containing protein n=1 Tax=Clostridium sp. D33t1_170424_F3 TaxID=2787099 RepID=UPI0018ABCD23|nr:GGDEF domain-containing phosphodiesterase [Clostridium sp. D33t1_170424_F3]
MKKYSRKRILLSAGVLSLILAAVIGAGTLLRNEMVRIRQSAAENILFYYTEKIMLQLNGTMNDAGALAQTALVMNGDETDWFVRASAPLLAREEIRYVCLFEGDTLVSALPGADYGELEGRDLQDFCYAFTLAKVVKDTIIEGPFTPEFDPAQQEVFLFLQPVVDGDVYLGEVVVALDRDYVLEQLSFKELYAQGYDYELWRVEPQNGAKEVIVTTNPVVDFSQAKKSTFYLPSQWNLSIQPADGWFSSTQKTGLILACALLTCLLLALACLAHRLFLREREKRQQNAVDTATGLYNQKGFTVELDRWLTANCGAVMLFYFSLEGFDQAARLIGPTQEAAFLRSIPERFNGFIRKPFIAGRLGSGNFILAVREAMSERQQEDFAKGLSLELLLRVRINDKKDFLMARYQCVRCRTGSGRAEEEIAALLHAYYDKIAQESPVRMLTEKCNQLVEGNTAVIFDEYTDGEMTDLSKALNRYRKRVEQLVYRDPVFHVGNRPKYFRDTDMLISYDAKRRFNLFCVDICAFSQYNELFSTDVGDAILHEVLNRLSRPLGTYLYRINGDVFLGISLSTENMESLAACLYQMLISPVIVGNATIPLQVRVAACQYPAHGAAPGALLDHLQSAIRFSKESGQNIVLYNDTLDELLHTEADILHHLSDAIQKRTLEVWYQPMVYLETGCFSAAEALVRLPDGKGGYYSAGQVISLAERNGLVERLGDYVLRSACAFMRTYGDSLGLKRISVNLSVQQLLVGNSAEHLLSLIRTDGVDPHRVTLEITESVLIQAIDHMAETLKLLRQAGIRIALDDFGVGYSSLNYLSNLPVDIIKIDRSLTKQILTNEKQRALLNSIVEMAIINDLTVVAEGVETEAEQKLIGLSGVHYIQGYYYARPMPEEKVSSFLNDARK